ncbi:hypothetical protein DERF_005365 [Dermatophagoides farinae]|uniref:Uncharacterized protein n=1 Tax=Dermatophagoides farinae TaxID=6954 RepID=A0A922I999_DERFA|nr:hypothetical protein HUG17_3601 [Dermatophagoides farinae]KAH9521733.1 hypothetical protein DERF_005365 [Dermatophagoides farinae]
MISNNDTINSNDDNKLLSDEKSISTTKFDSQQEMVTTKSEQQQQQQQQKQEQIQPKTSGENFGQRQSDSPKQNEKRLISLTENLQKIRIAIADWSPKSDCDDLPKRPGWRCPTSSNHQSTTTTLNAEIEKFSNEKFESLLMIKSDTSISSNGPLKEFIRKQKPNVCHQAKITFKLDPNIVIEAAQRADVLDRQPIRAPSLSSISDSEKKKKQQQQKQPQQRKTSSKERSSSMSVKSSDNNKTNKFNKTMMIIDENISPLIRNSLQRVQVFSLITDVQDTQDTMIETTIDSSPKSTTTTTTTTPTSNNETFEQQQQNIRKSID